MKRKRYVQLLAVALSLTLILAPLGKAATTNTTPTPAPPAAPGLQGGRSGSGTALPDLFTGTISSSVPIEVPPGRKGMDPGLSLDYRSNNGDGWVGFGWELEIGAIERSTKFGVFYTDDNYVLRIGGATIDLINVGTNEYRAQIESGFSRIRKMNAADGRPYWEVTDTVGTRYLFGQGIASRQDNPANANQIFRWSLDRVEDSNGNFMTTTYTKDQGQIYPSQITYAGNGALPPTNAVKFILESRTDPGVLYTPGFQIRTAYRLKAVEVLGGSTPVRKYELQYDSSGATGRSRVRSILQYGKDFSSRLPAIEFSYQGGVGSSLAPQPTYSTGVHYNGGENPTMFTVVAVDLNGDGRQDLVHVRTDGGGKLIFKPHLSNGSGGFVSQPTYSTGVHFNGGEDTLFTVLPLDINGDGRQDLVHVRTNNRLLQFTPYLSNGSGGFVPQPLYATGVSYNGDENPTYFAALPADLNGDGREDLVHVRTADVGKIIFKPHLTNGPVPDLLASITNGLGSVSSIEYKPSTQSNQTQLPFPIQTVSAIGTCDGNGVCSTEAYDYAGGYYSFTDRDFRGFKTVTVTKPFGQKMLITTTQFHQGNDTAVDANTPAALVGYTKGKPYRVQVRVADNSSSQVISETTTSYVPDDTPPYFNPPLQVESTFEGKTTRVAYQYDTYGNVIREDHYSDIADPTDDRTTTRSFSPNAPAWIVGLPTNESIYQGIGTTTKVAATDFYYDGTTSCQTPSTTQTPTRGNLTRTVRWLSGGTGPEIRVAYDNYGNPICTRDANGNIATVTYDSSATFPLTARNPLGHTTTTQYSGVNGVPADAGLYGQVKSMTDANGATTTTQYDVFGRPIQVTAPDGSSARTSYIAFGGGVGTQHVRKDTSGGLSSWNYFDGLGRTIKEKSTGPDGKVIVTEMQYDSNGRVVKSSLPYFEGGSPLWRTMTYDSLGRLLSVVSPDGSRGSSCYQNWVSVSIDANNHRRRETRDAAGRVVKVEEYQGTFTTCTIDVGTPYATTQYKYDVLGNLLTVTDAQGNVTRMQYDTLGRKRFMHDPDMGDWNYDYDFNGNLVRQMDGKGQVLTFGYDPLNRPTVKYLPGGKQITYTYDDPATFGIGRLFRVNDATGSTTFTYDRMGRVIKTAKTVQPDGIAIVPATYITQTAYDALGRVSSIGYPDNSVVNYGYNGPLLARVSDQGTVYVSYTSYNALGQPARQTFGNGVTTDFTYANPSNTTCPEANSRPCTTKTLGVAGTYQDYLYRYDRGGNIVAIGDTVNGNQAFQYDDLNRLLAATGSYGTLNYSYDKISNLLCNSQISPCSATSPNYVYPASGPNSIGPHAAIRVGAGTFKYDANGNMLDGSGRALAYDAENRLVTAATAQGNTRFVYDGDGGRVLKIIGASITTYIGKLYECVDGQCIKYIFAGDQRIAQRQVNSTSVYYYHADHLGSTRVVTDAAGKKVQSLTYFPFGETHQQQGTLNVRHKYTGQERHDTSALYFYGGRYYDPVLARFTSADSVTPGFADPQGLNRYAYVRNNPLLYTDPTGHRWKWFDKQRRSVAKVLSRTVYDVARINYVGGLLATGLLSTPLFAAPYGMSTGDWTSVGRATATSAVLAAAMYIAPPAATVDAGLGGTLGYAAGHAAAGFVSGAGIAAINGADANTAFRRGYQGAALAGGLAVVDKVALGMRKAMVEQSERCGCVGKDSVGYRNDGVKIGGGRYTQAGEPTVTWLGGSQTGPGQTFNIPYGKGSFRDLLVETYAGPHDFFNSAFGIYTRNGRLAGNVWWLRGGATQIVDLILATPIAAGSAVAPVSLEIVGAGAIDDYD